MTKPQPDERAPAFQFYPDDYLSDDAVEAMSLTEQGAYMRLLCHAWKAKQPGYLENDDDLLARLSRLGRAWPKSKARILRAFRISDDGLHLMQKRMIRTHASLISFRKQKQEAGVEGARQRWEKTRATDGTAIVSPLADGMANDASSSSSASSSLKDPIPPTPQTTDRGSQPTLFDVPTSAPDQPPAVEPKKKQGADTAAVDALLEELSAARVRARRGSKVLRPTPTSRKHIAARLAEGYAAEDVRHVIAVCEEESRRWRAGGGREDPFQWFNAVTPFLPDNFQRKLGRAAPSSLPSNVTPLRSERRSPGLLPGYTDIDDDVRLIMAGTKAVENGNAAS